VRARWVTLLRALLQLRWRGLVCTNPAQGKSPPPPPRPTHPCADEAPRHFRQPAGAMRTQQNRCSRQQPAPSLQPQKPGETLARDCPRQATRARLSCRAQQATHPSTTTHATKGVASKQAHSCPQARARHPPANQRHPIRGVGQVAGVACLHPAAAPQRSRHDACCRLQRG
jgi:hypothetical protein